METVCPAGLHHLIGAHHAKLARRHVAYGVRPEHYQPVGAALLWTLEQGLGDQFTEETRAAWTHAYGTLAEVMIEAARAENELNARAG